MRVFLLRPTSICLFSVSLCSRYVICGDVNVMASPWYCTCGGSRGSYSSVEMAVLGFFNCMVAHASNRVSVLTSCGSIGAYVACCFRSLAQC